MKITAQFDGWKPFGENVNLPPANLPRQFLTMQNIIALLSLSILISFGCSSKTTSDAPKQSIRATGSKTVQAHTKTSPPNKTTETKQPKPQKKAPVPQNQKEVTLQNKDQKARVTFTLPKGWTLTQKGPEGAQLIPPQRLHKDYVRTQCQLKFGIRQCVDLCTTEHTLAGLEGSWENWSKQWVDPATRTGKPAKNTVKTSWKTVTDDKKKGFRLISGLLTYPAEVKNAAVYQDRIVTRCTQMNLGDTLSLDAECRGALEYETELREGFESFCRSITIKQHPVPKTKEEELPSSKSALQPVVPAEKPASTPSSKQ